MDFKDLRSANTSPPSFIMDQLLQVMLSFPPHPPPSVPLSDAAYDAGIKEQIASLKRAASKKFLQKTSSGDQLLDILNPALNTIPYAMTLVLWIEASGKNKAEETFLWEKLGQFLQSFDARQVRYIGPEFTKITESVMQYARNNGNKGAAVPLISRALLRLDPDGTMLTSTHLSLVNLALESRNFQGVPAVISRPVLYFPGKLNPSRITLLCNLGLPSHAYITQTAGFTRQLKSIEILEYFYYSGCVLIALRQWDKAVEILEDAICYPCKDNATSKVMVMAYKKWILATLLWKGKLGKPPATITIHTLKAFHAIAKPYETIGELFMTSTAQRLKQEVEFGQKIWRDDYNFGLVWEVLGAYQKHQIRALSNVYAALSMSEVTRKTFSGQTGRNLSDDNSTENLIRQMIAEGSLNASIGKNPGGPAILRFEPIQALNESEMAQKLGAAVKSIQAVTKDIKYTDHRLTEDKEYIKWAVQQRKAGNKGPVNSLHSTVGEEMDLNWPEAAEEDLMSA